MNVTKTILTLFCASSATAAFVPHQTPRKASTIVVKGYLDDLNKDLYSEDATPDVVADSREANVMDKGQVDRFGPGNLDQFVDFDEFDGGDGQMGVAGDGSKGLDKSDFASSEIAQSMDKSRARSAKNAWGTSTGYADELVEKGVDIARAQQLENWANQREVSARKQQQQYMTEQFDKVEENAEADWRTLAKFGVERNAEFDMDDEFGPVTEVGGDIEGTIELTSRPGGGIGYHEFGVKNPYMGFADFRAALTPGTSAGWTITPAEGSLSKEPTPFTLKFRPESIGQSEGYLVIETEDFKKVWKLIGSTG